MFCRFNHGAPRDTEIDRLTGKRLGQCVYARHAIAVTNQEVAATASLRTIKYGCVADGLKKTVKVVRLLLASSLDFLVREPASIPAS
jgi:hypothetical protein